MIRRFPSHAALVTLIQACAVSSPVLAEDIAAFYKGKTLNIVVGHQTGTGFDLYARVLSRHIGRHIPGKPEVIVQNMNGASGLRSLNWLANIGPKDGTAIATMTFSAPFEPLLGAGKGKFDATKFVWIGNMDASVSVCGVSRKAGIASFDDVLNKPLTVGATGGSGPFIQVPTALKNLLGAKLEIVAGYKGSRSVKLAIERGEVNGACGPSLSTVRTQYADLQKKGDFKLILQVGPEPHPGLKDVPHVYKYAKTADERKIFDVIFGIQGLGRAFMGAADIPHERAKALQKAFMDTMNDKELHAEARKINLDLRPESGEKVSAFVKQVYATPAALLERAKKAVKTD
ncbi:MAG: Bug family tripartite tricarboxylate transporter substrate binding protein [Beijerinckiaceae bacterium]